MGSKILELIDVNIFYGSKQVVYNVNVYVAIGELVYLMGRNGAGKTTTLKSIMGIIPPRSGSIKLEGVEIAGRQPFELAELGVGYVPDDKRIFPFLTIRQNLELFSKKRKNNERWTVEKIYDIFPILRKRELNRGGTLSGGEQEMLAVARALMRNPKLLLSDEPFEGLAPLIIEHLGEVFESIKGEVSILLVEQNIKPSIKIADRLYSIERGEIKSEYKGKEMAQFLNASGSSG